MILSCSCEVTIHQHGYGHQRPYSNKKTSLRMQRFGEKIAMPLSRPFVANHTLAVGNTLRKEVTTSINLFTVESSHSAVCRICRLSFFTGTPNPAVRKNKTPGVLHENRLTKTCGHFHVLLLRGRTPNEFLRHRVKR